MSGSTRLLIFSDLDGTLLDPRTYSSAAAAPALAEVRARRIPLILVSSKTRAEMEALRADLDLDGPFVVENGGAVYLPAGLLAAGETPSTRRGPYEVVEFGTPYPILRRALKEIGAALGAELQGFGDLSVAEVAAATGLGLAEAERAKQREYDEPFRVLRGADVTAVRREAERRGLLCQGGGRYQHLLGRHDKGVACRYLIDRYRRVSDPGGELVTIALGDAANDLPMLALVDHPVLVQKPDGSYEPLDLPAVSRTEGIGPIGWNRAVLGLVPHLLDTVP